MLASDQKKQDEARARKKRLERLAFANGETPSPFARPPLDLKSTPVDGE